jgi:hypothetical protein
MMERRPRPSEIDQRCIIVIGMHRSGTSAMTGVLHYLGVDLGNDLMSPKPDNPKGFWEHREIYKIHEELLNNLGSVWDDIRPLPQNWWLEEDAKKAQDDILAVLRRDFRKSKLWGLKDPRLCRLMALWHPIFSQLQCAPNFIIVFRNPEEVAASLNNRNGLMRKKALIFWLDHLLESERGTRDYPRVFVSMEQLLNNWQAIMEKIGGHLNIEWPIDFHSAKTNIDEFLDHKLKHHNISNDKHSDDPDTFGHVLATYGELRNVAYHDKDLQTGLYSKITADLQKERGRFMNMAMAEDIGDRLISISGISSLLAQKDHQLAQKNQQLAQKDVELSRKDTQLTEILNSNSWKMTSPLRKAFDLIRYLIPNNREQKGK